MKIEFENIYCKIKPSSDLNVDHCGRQICDAAYSYGPCVRDSYLIHFVINGKGNLYTKKHAYRIQENEGFMIFPGDENTYTADSIDPWHYYWVGFNGSTAGELVKRCGITRENPIISGDSAFEIKKAMIDLFEETRRENYREYALTGRLYILLSRMLKPVSTPQTASKRVFDAAIKIIAERYGEDITVESLSKNLYVDRTYLFRVFKKESALSPVAYIASYRLKKAKDLLAMSGYKLSDIAIHCGYGSLSAFCKAFKSAYNVSAKEYRNRL